MEKLRFGIAGCGNIAKRFALALSKSEGAELYACAARDPEKAKAFAEAHGAQVCYGDYQSMIEDENVQAVYIATVHTTHAQIAQACINAGKAVISEKPFFISSKEAEETIALAKEKGVLIMEGFWTRMMPAFLKAKEWIRDGKIGELHLIRASFCFNMPYNEYTKDGRMWRPELAGGALWDAGVYPYEYATGIMDSEPEEVKTLVQRGINGVDTAVTMSMRFPGGVIADCLTAINGFMESSATLSGSKGYITQEYFVGCRKTSLYQGRGELVETFEDPEEEGFVHEVAHFVDLYRSGKKESDMIPLKDTLAFTRRAEQILQSDQPKKISKFSLEELAAQEEKFRFESFTAKEALKLGNLMAAMAEQDQKDAAIQIELGGMEVFRSMAPGTGAYNDLWMSKKKNTVKLMGKSTLRLWTEMASRGVPRVMGINPPDIVFCGGGFPILLKDGTLVGVIAVSGPGDEYEHDLIVRALEELMK